MSRTYREFVDSREFDIRLEQDWQEFSLWANSQEILTDHELDLLQELEELF